MKKVLVVFTAVLIMLTMFSCKKAIENSVDCIAQSLNVSLESTLDENNSKLVHFKLTKTDSPENNFTLDSKVKFDFGDGNTQTIEGSEVSHEYNASGSYTVKVDYNLRRGNLTCSPQKEKTIKID